MDLQIGDIQETALITLAIRASEAVCLFPAAPEQPLGGV